MSWVLVADVGGTWTRAARLPWPPPEAQPPRLEAHVRHPTRQRDPTTGLIQALREVAPDAGPVHAIAVAVPGPLDPYQGVVLTAPNLPAWRHEPLQLRLEDAFGVPVRVGNDANLAALGEARFGAARGYRHVVYLTLSTGVGGGVLVDGRLLLGARGLAAELGHITVDPQGPPCGCGGRGHLEALVSGPALVRLAREGLPHHPESLLHRVATLSGEAIAQAARQGDPLAQDVLQRAGRFLGRALADLCHVFNPEIIVLGGGVAQAGPWLWDAAREALEQALMSPAYHPELQPARLGDRSGLLGAYALLMATADSGPVP